MASQQVSPSTVLTFYAIAIAVLLAYLAALAFILSAALPLTFLQSFGVVLVAYALMSAAKTPAPSTVVTNYHR